MSHATPQPLAILGAGSWGTALALYLAKRGQVIHLYSVDATEISEMLENGANNRYLPGILLPATIQPNADLSKTITAVTDILIVVPSHAFRQTILSLKPLLQPGQRLICATKGLDATTQKLLSAVVSEILGTSQLFAVLSGPSFAKEVALGLPVAVDIAANDEALLADLKTRFNSPIFRVHASDDIIGLEISGAMKNVIAVLIGIADGLQLGASAKSALMTLGLAEMRTLGVALGAKAQTFTGFAALGDLILTCGDDLSRNRRFGYNIGQGMDINEAIKNVGQVVEGYQNTHIVTALAKKHQIVLPLCEATYNILHRETPAKTAISEIFAHI